MGTKPPNKLGFAVQGNLKGIPFFLRTCASEKTLLSPLQDRTPGACAGASPQTGESLVFSYGFCFRLTVPGPLRKTVRESLPFAEDRRASIHGFFFPSE